MHTTTFKDWFHIETPFALQQYRICVLHDLINAMSLPHLIRHFPVLSVLYSCFPRRRAEVDGEHSGPG